jgi:hypothetical protein
MSVDIQIKKRLAHKKNFWTPEKNSTGNPSLVKDIKFSQIVEIFANNSKIFSIFSK